MTLSEAKRYHAYARHECLQLAEEAERAEVQASLSELSHIWMEAALKEDGAVISRSSGLIGPAERSAL
jgi:hypothetical protein